MTRLERGSEDDTALAIETEIDLSEEFDRAESAWEDLFLTLLSASAKEDLSPEDAVFEDYFAEEEGSQKYLLRVRGVFVDDNNQPTVINLDVYEKGVHTQSLSGQASWEDGKPEITGVNNSPVEIKDRWFNIQELAIEAKAVVSGRGLQTDSLTGLPKNTIFPIPKPFLTHIQ